MLIHTRPLADVLTVSRAFLAILLAVLGATRGADALPAAVLIVVTSWVTDILDGPLARRDPRDWVSWVGQHDAEADLSVSLGVTAYLVLSGYLAGWLGAVLALVTLLLWVFHSHQLAWPVYAVPYVVLIAWAFRVAPFTGWVAGGYLALVLVVRWPRLRYEFLPEFFRAVDSLHRDRE